MESSSIIRQTTAQDNPSIAAAERSQQFFVYMMWSVQNRTVVAMATVVLEHAPAATLGMVRSVTWSTARALVATVMAAAQKDHARATQAGVDHCVANLVHSAGMDLGVCSVAGVLGTLCVIHLMVNVSAGLDTRVVVALKHAALGSMV